MAVFVPDASATLAWLLEGETSDWTEALLERFRSGDSAVVPSHWAPEVANALLVAVRRGRIDKHKPAELFAALLALPIRVDTSGSEAIFHRVFAYAEKYGLTVYDAAYLELAVREGVALATLDTDLQNAALLAGIPLA
jgi:predicted nucleic acid-binding protein